MTAESLDAGWVLLITGPIGAGKSTVAGLTAELLNAAGVSSASVDLDDIVFMQKGSALADLEWQRARVAHATLVAAWLRAGVRVVVAHGPICSPEEREILMSEAPDDVHLRVALLNVPLDRSIDRVLGDESRRPEAQSRVVDFLRGAHARLEALVPELRSALTWEFDTTEISPEAIAHVLSEATR